MSHPLKERKVGAYYGCLLLRPGAVLTLDDVESPTVMEAFIKALGAEPVIYSMRNECCGGYLALRDKAQCEQLVSEIKIMLQAVVRRSWSLPARCARIT